MAIITQTQILEFTLKRKTSSHRLKKGAKLKLDIVNSRATRGPWWPRARRKKAAKRSLNATKQHRIKRRLLIMTLIRKIVRLLLRAQFMAEVVGRVLINQLKTKKHLAAPTLRALCASTTTPTPARTERTA